MSAAGLFAWSLYLGLFSLITGCAAAGLMARGETGAAPGLAGCAAAAGAALLFYLGARRANR